MHVIQQLKARVINNQMSLISLSKVHQNSFLYLQGFLFHQLFHFPFCSLNSDPTICIMAKPCPANIYLLKVNNRNIRNVSSVVLVSVTMRCNCRLGGQHLCGSISKNTSKFILAKCHISCETSKYFNTFPQHIRIYDSSGVFLITLCLRAQHNFFL